MSAVPYAISLSSRVGSLAGRKKTDGEYHEPCERSEFYHMRELDKPAAIFIAPEDFDTRYLEGPLGFDLEVAAPANKKPRLNERSKFMSHLS